MVKTSSLLTCMSNSQLTASYFNVEFYPSNQTVVFDIDASTTITGNIIAEFSLIAYGLNVLQETVNPCKLGITELCPLAESAGRINVDSNYQVSDTIVDMIPGVAYTIPDLDARVRVLVYAENDTSTALACVEAILTNGKTVQTKYAAWPIAAISGVGLITSGLISITGQSNTAAHIASNSISLFVYFQNLAITSMMAVSRVPPIASSWSQNFQWSMGIIKTAFMQTAIKWYVQATGGTSTVVLDNTDILSISVQKRHLLENLANHVPSVVQKLLKRSSDYDFDDDLTDTSLYTTDEHDVDSLTSKILVLRGIERVAYLAGIELSNFFLTGIVFFLFFLFVVIIAIISFKALVELLARTNAIKPQKFEEFRKHWGYIIKGTLFRLSLIAFPQISLLCLWELTERDSSAIVVVACFLLVIVFGLLLYGATRVIIIGRRSTREFKTAAYLLYGDSRTLNRFGFLYVQFKADHYWWLTVLLAYTLLRSLFVAVLQEQGKVQALIIFIVEFVYFVALCWIRPYMDKRTNAFNISIHLVNFFNSLMFLFFSNLFGQPQVVSSVCAVVFFVVNAIFALFLLIFTIVTCALALIYKNPDTRYQPMKDDRVSFIPRSTYPEKSNKGDTELLALGETAISGHQPEQLLLDDQDDSTKYPSTHLTSNSRSRTESFNSNNFVTPVSAVYNDSANNNYRNVNFQDTSYHGAVNRNGSNDNPYNRARQNESSYNSFI
ncbi:hypothetical protein WICMUC_003318 [Wickerhamomyces mucosus]|uniref:ML-like domain-containing protein n=1 Tax=Wickerhamomyces mucosus TaxID=1378264 RepID=A0A9P8TDG2_9ASCO|nr:hypothetical protein WICMUC_003318 [Wickerhamomyces mucosus]